MAVFVFGGGRPTVDDVDDAGRARTLERRIVESRVYLRGELDAELASMAKYWCSDLQGKVVDAGVQLHGGNGFMAEFPIARAYVDARAQRIYGGTNEIMKELIARDLDL